MPRPSGCKGNSCKHCGGEFGKDHCPLSKDSSQLLKPRAPGTLLCQPCYGFVRNDPEFGDLTASALIEALKNPDTKAKFMSRRAAWCEDRRSGKRRKPGDLNAMFQMCISVLSLLVQCHQDELI